MTQNQHPRAVAAEANSDQLQKRLWLRAVMLFVILGLMAVLAASSFGQYEVKRLENEERYDAAAKEMLTLARGYATTRDVSGYTGVKLQKVQFYFQSYLPTKITQPESAHKITEMMSEANALLERGLRSGAPGAGQMLRWMYGSLKPIAVGNYHPAARINAVLFISRLARPSAQRGAPPVPYAFVLTDLLPIYQDQSAPEAVRAAALQGLERYVRYAAEQVSDAQKQELTAEMKKLLAADAPADRDELVHAFLQRYAVSILTNLNSDPALGVQLVGISTDENKPDLIALQAAATIGMLPAQMKAGEVETPKVLKQWATRLLATMETELARVEDLAGIKKKTTMGVTQPRPPESFLQVKTEATPQKPVPGMMGGMDPYGGMMDEMMEMDDMMAGDEMEGMDMMEMMMGPGMFGMSRTKAESQPPEVTSSRKKINHVIQQVWLGVTGTTEAAETAEEVADIKAQGGLMAATAPESMGEVTRWLEAVNAVTLAINDETIGRTNDYVSAVKEQIEALKEYLESEGGQKRSDPELPDGFDLDPLAALSN